MLTFHAESYMPELSTPTVAEIVANPAAHGFVWFTGEVEKDGRTFKSAQLVKHIDVTLLRATFGDTFFTASMDGTSRHVTNQRINRDAWYSALGETPSRVPTELQLRTLIVENMLGQKSARRRTVVIETRYEAMDGKQYATQLEMQQANLAWFADQQINAQ